MASIKLMDWDMDDEPFVLIGLHSTIEPYRMAYFINKYLKVSFKRLVKDQDVTLKGYEARFPVYHYKDEEENASFYLVPNHCKAQVKSTSSAGGLFQVDHMEQIKTTLIKEYRTVDYFLKIEKDPILFPLRKMLSKLNEIPPVISVYPTDTAVIKNKDYLIFE